MHGYWLISASRKWWQDNGEVSESAEGARLLSEYTGLNLYPGFESLPLRQKAKKETVKTVSFFMPTHRRSPQIQIAKF